MKDETPTTWALWAIIILIIITAALCGCADISALDVNLGGGVDPITGASRVTLGTRFEFGNKPAAKKAKRKRLPNYAKDK